VRSAEAKQQARFQSCCQCHACPGVDSPDLPSTKEIFRSLLACKQLYHEAYPALQTSICLHIAKPGALEDIRQCSRKALRSRLRYLRLIIHLNNSSRELWKHELCNLPTTFPNVEKLDILNHMRPLVSFQNLSDAIYLAGPVVHFPPRMTPRLHFAYIEDEENVFDGRAWYNILPRRSRGTRTCHQGAHDRPEIQRPFTQFQHRAYDKQVDADNTLLRRAMAGKHPPAEEKPRKALLRQYEECRPDRLDE